MATLDQELRESKAEPEETELPETARDAEMLHPNMTTETTRRVYNLHKGKHGNRGPDYSHCFGDH